MYYWYGSYFSSLYVRGPLVPRPSKVTLVVIPLPTRPSVIVITTFRSPGAVVAP